MRFIAQTSLEQTPCGSHIGRDFLILPLRPPLLLPLPLLVEPLSAHRAYNESFQGDW